MKGSDHDVTIVSVTAAHPDSIKNFIRSVRAFYPDIPFILAGAADIYARCESFFAEQNVHYIALEAGCGVAYGLNACVARAKTRFILFCDAHCLFTDKTDLLIPLQALKAHEEIGLVTGQMSGRKCHDTGDVCTNAYPEKYLYLDSSNHVLLSVPVFYLSPRTILVNKNVYYQCDIGAPFALVRKAVFSGKILWDANFKYEGWYEDLCLTLKYSSSWGCVWSPDFCCQAQAAADKPPALVKERQADWDAFSKKWHVTDHLDIGCGLRAFDHYLDAETWRVDSINPLACLPRYKDSYLRLLPNGTCLASDTIAADPGNDLDQSPHNRPQNWADLEKTYQRYNCDRATLIWKICRPFMKLEQSLRKRIRGLKSHG